MKLPKKIETKRIDKRTVGIWEAGGSRRMAECASVNAIEDAAVLAARYNAHEELVEALEVFVEWVETNPDKDADSALVPKDAFLMRNARALLARLGAA